MGTGRVVRWKALVAVCVVASLGAGCSGKNNGVKDCYQTMCTSVGPHCEAGEVAVDCKVDDKGCYVRTNTLCATCIEVSSTEVTCSCDDPQCVGASDGDVLCDGDLLVTCTADKDGCLVAGADDCTKKGETCDDSTTPAMCVSSAGCTDNPACAGMSDGDTTCSGGMVNQCNVGGDGCLDLTQENCGAALCDDSGGTPACGSVTQSGEDCANAIPVLSSTFSLSGTSFVTDFTDDVTVTGTSCNTGAGNDVADAVLSMDLTAGDKVAVTESGYLYSVINMQSGTCGGAETCVASGTDPNVDPLTFTAPSTGTFYLIVEPYGTGYDGSYDIQVSINPDCGNGLLEAGEQCDDDNTTAGDGCTDCKIDYGDNCDGQSPTTCQADVDLGTGSAGSTLTYSTTDPRAAGDQDWYTFTIDTPAIVTVNTKPNNAQDTGGVSVYLENTGGTINSDSNPTGLDTTVGPETLRPGKYVLQFDTEKPQPNGIGMAVLFETVPTVGAGDTIQKTGGAIAQFSSDFFSYTVTAPVEVTGTLTTGGGDANFDTRYLYRYFAEHNDQGDETIDSVLLPGTYLFEVTAYTNVTSYNLDLSLAAATPMNIGTFAAGDTIPATNGGPLTARAYDHYEITFTNDVLLSATLSGNSTGDTGLVMYDADHEPVYSFGPGDETVTDELLTAGTYVVQIRTKSAAFGGGDVDAYTLTMSTKAAP